MSRLIASGESADVLYVNGLFFETALANLKLRKPLVVKVVGDEAWERSVRRGWTRRNFDAFQAGGGSLRTRLLKRLRNWPLKRADRVIAPSRYLARTAEAWGIPKEKIEVVPNSAPVPASPTPLDPGLPSGVRVAAVGRLVAWKQTDRVIEAVAQLPGISLAVVGDGPQRKALQALAERLGVEDRVRLTGRREHSETLSILAGCDLFVLFSTYEGLPHVLLEAMSLGLPCVASRVGGIPEVIEDGVNGLLVDPRSDDQLRRALERLMDDGAERRRIGDNARKSMDRFSLGRTVDGLERVLALACRDGGAGVGGASPKKEFSGPA